MAINLQDIRTAVVAYVDTKVTASVSAITPTTGAGSTLESSERFDYVLTAQNPTSANGGIPLTNFIWYVRVEDETVGKLIVPVFPEARANLNTSTPLLSPGAPVKEMYLFTGSFGVGITRSLGLHGQAGTEAGGKATNLKFNIYADVDLDWLFPRIQDSPTVTTPLAVTANSV